MATTIGSARELGIVVGLARRYSEVPRHVRARGVRVAERRVEVEGARDAQPCATEVDSEERGRARLDEVVALERNGFSVD